MRLPALIALFAACSSATSRDDAGALWMACSADGGTWSQVEQLSGRLDGTVLSDLNRRAEKHGCAFVRIEVK